MTFDSRHTICDICAGAAALPAGALSDAANISRTGRKSLTDTELGANELALKGDGGTGPHHHVVPLAFSALADDSSDRESIIRIDPFAGFNYYFSRRQIDLCKNFTAHHAYDEATFTKFLIDCIRDNVLRVSPVRPAYAVVSQLMHCLDVEDPEMAEMSVITCL